MKKGLLMLSLFAAVTMLFAGVASAEMFSGKVQSTDPAAKSLEVSRTNPATGAEENLSIMVQDNTTFSGVSSLSDLKQGQEVWVTAEKDDAGSWMAGAIEISGEEMAGEGTTAAAQ